MAQIDLGKFGRASPVVERQPIAPARPAVAWAAAHHLGETIERLSKDLLDDYEREQKVLSQAKADTAAQGYSVEASKLAIAAQARMEGGEMSPRDAVAWYKDALAGVKVPEVEGMDDPLTVRYQGAIKQASDAGELRILNAMGRVAEKDQNRTAAALVESAIDNAVLAENPAPLIAKLAADLSPGGAAFKAFGTEKAATTLADAVSKVHAQRLSLSLSQAEASGDAVKAQQIVTALADDQSTLSAAVGVRRAQALAHADTTLRQIKARAKHEEDSRETEGERAKREYTAGLVAGVSFSADQMETFRTKVSGTKSEQEFTIMVEQAPKIAAVAKGSPVENRAALDDITTRLAAAQASGDTALSVTLARQVEVMAKAADRARTTMLTNPISFIESRTGKVMPSLSETDLADPAKLKTLIGGRTKEIRALRATEGFGRYIPMAPLKPDEAAAIGTALMNGSALQKGALLRALNNASDGDIPLYQAMVGQVVPQGSGVIALAGLRMTPTSTTHAGSTSKAPPPYVGEAILRGWASLTGGEGNKDKNETMSSLKVPGADAFWKVLFNKTNLAEADEGSLPVIVDAARYYFAGMMGRFGGFDPMQEDDIAAALEHVAGETTKMGWGLPFKGRVMVPWGMEKGDFLEKIKAAYIATMSEGRFKGEPNGAWTIYAVPGSGGTRYGFLDPERRPIADAKDNARPLELDISDQ